MKNKEQKILKKKILIAFKKALKLNNADVTSKVEKAMKKSIKQIVKKTFKSKSVTTTVNSPEIKTRKKLLK